MKYAKIEHVKLPRSTPDKLRFYAANCRTLATLVSELEPWQHEQSVWVVGINDNECGTRGCALGWAVISGRFTGLQYTYGNDAEIIYPVIDGAICGWVTTGEIYFGERACANIFESDMSKENIVHNLRKLASLYELEATYEKAKDTFNEAIYDWERLIGSDD